MKRRNVYAASLSNRCFKLRIVQTKKRKLMDKAIRKEVQNEQG